MQNKDRILLIIDCIVNLVLGIILLLFPLGTASFLGIPVPDHNFYPTILGAVLFGIGIALLLEIRLTKKNRSGLGLDGAIAINLCGSLVLLAWLVLTDLDLPLRGLIILWFVGLGVFLIGIIELISRSNNKHTRKS